MKMGIQVRRWGLLFSVAALMIYGAGCGAASDQKTTEKRYSDDGYMGFSTANPGILTSPNAHTYGQDTEAVTQALAGLTSIRRVTVRYSGGSMVVNLRVERGLTAGETQQLRAEAERRLSSAIPRYKVRVRVYRVGILNR